MLTKLAYVDLLRQQDNLEHLCTFGTDPALLRETTANLARVNEEIADREAKGLTHLSYVPGLLLGDMEDETPGVT